MARQYHKLVRDEIPRIIREGGSTCRYRILDREDYRQLLDEKLDEELLEYRQSKDPEELADMLEVIAALAEEGGCSWEQLLAIREEKKKKRGGFTQRILLEEVID